MKMYLSLLGLLSLAACSRPLSPQPSCNFVENPEQQRVSWERHHLPLRLYIHKSVPVEANEAILRAVNEYNNRLGAEIFRIESFQAGGDLEPKKDGYSMIYWFNTTWCGMDRPNEQARTTIYWSGTEIFETDIRINAFNFTYNFTADTSFTNVDLTSLLVHELGHALGLAHNPASGSVMNAYLNFTQVRRTLSQTDLSNLMCAYK